MNQNDVLHALASFLITVIVWRVRRATLLLTAEVSNYIPEGKLRGLARQADFTQKNSGREEFVILSK
jgi:hypothetical protein